MVESSGRTLLLTENCQEQLSALLRASKARVLLASLGPWDGSRPFPPSETHHQRDPPLPPPPPLGLEPSPLLLCLKLPASRDPVGKEGQRLEVGRCREGAAQGRRAFKLLEGPSLIETSAVPSVAKQHHSRSDMTVTTMTMQQHKTNIISKISVTCSSE